jgi:transposase
MVRMSLVGGRQTIRFHIPDYSAKYAGYPTDTADLIEQDGRWWLHVVVTLPASQIEPTDQVVGVDVGISRPAVMSTNRFLGKKARMKARGRTQTKRRMHCWSFAQLKGFIGYKAEERGCTVAGVDPQHTSQRCSCCGHVARTNRRSQSVFMCRQYGYDLNADLNAARNIAAKYHADGGRAAVGGPNVNQPIVSNPLPLASG